ncbi:MAG: hypothetical protein H5T64_02855 [Chloroflexi bacterium]|nr:hypothetical protein [Chloroflexota bacterium]
MANVLPDISPEGTTPPSRGRNWGVIIIAMAVVVGLILLGALGVALFLRSRGGISAIRLLAATPTPMPTFTQMPTFTPLRPTFTPLPTVTPTSVPTLEPTATRVPTFTPLPPTLTPTPQAGEVPNTGFGDAVLFIGGFALVVVFFLARRLRLKSNF